MWDFDVGSDLSLVSGRYHEKKKPNGEQLGNLLRMRQFGPSCIIRIYFARVVAGALNS